MRAQSITGNHDAPSKGWTNAHKGMVEIRIHSPLRTVPDLQEELISRLGLRECLVLAALDRDSQTFEATDTVTQVAALAAHYLHAPMLVTDATVRAGLLRDPHLRKSLEVARRADTLVSSVGTPGREHDQCLTGYLSDADLEYIQAQGGVGDIRGAHYDDPSYGR